MKTMKRVDARDAQAVLDVLTGTWRAQALHATVALGIPDLIAAGDVSPEAIAAKVGATPDRIVRLLRLMVATGVVAVDPAGAYRLTGAGELLRDGPGSMRDLVLIYGEEFYRAWGSFRTAVATGRPGFQEALGVRLHDHLADSPAVAARFQAAMGAGNVFFDALPEVYDFSGGTTVVDVAGGGGALLAAVMRASPNVHGVLFDRAGAAEIGRRQLAAAFPPERFDVVAGDMFESVPPGGDVYLLSRILQDWDDDAGVALLANIRAVLTGPARLLILERVIPHTVAAGGPQLSLLYDLHLLNMAGGGQRTLAGYRSILTRAGLSLSTTLDLPLDMSLLVVQCAPA